MYQVKEKTDAKCCLVSPCRLVSYCECHPYDLGMVFSYHAYASGTLPQGLGGLGIVAGAGYVLTIVGFLWGGEQHPLTGLGGLTAVISYPIWAIWFSRLLLSGRVLA